MLGLMPIISFLSTSKLFFKIIGNWGLMKKILSDTQTILTAMVNRKDPLPDCNETKILMDNVKRLLEAGFIDLPMVDENEIARVLGNIENNIVCSLDPKKLESMKNGQQ